MGSCDDYSQHGHTSQLRPSRIGGDILIDTPPASTRHIDRLLDFFSLRISGIRTTSRSIDYFEHSDHWPSCTTARFRSRPSSAAPYVFETVPLSPYAHCIFAPFRRYDAAQHTPSNVQITPLGLSLISAQSVASLMVDRISGNRAEH